MLKTFRNIIVAKQLICLLVKIKKITQMSNQTNWGDVNFSMPTYCNIVMEK